MRSAVPRCGNNNAYCQDNELTWYDWNLDRATASRLMEFTSNLIQLRLSHPNLHRRISSFRTAPFKGGKGAVERDIAWYNTNGERVLADESWGSALESNRSALMLNGNTLNYTER